MSVQVGYALVEIVTSSLRVDGVACCLPGTNDDDAGFMRHVKLLMWWDWADMILDGDVGREGDV